MSIRSLFLHPLGPALVLALGGLLLALSRRVFPDPLSRSGAVNDSVSPVETQSLRLIPMLRVLFAVAIAVMALADMLLLRLKPIQTGLSWTWQPLTVAGGAFDWRVDGWNWLAGLLILLLTVTALSVGDFNDDLTRGRSWPGKNAERTLWLGAVALVFVFSGNVVTMASVWLLLDAVLAFRLRPGEAATPSGRVWSLLSLSGLVLLGVLALLGEPGVRSVLALGPFDPLVLGLLWIVALIRAGVYPFHFWLTGPGRTDAGGRVALHLIAPLTGLWLLGRVNQVAGADWLRFPAWAALGALALLGTALVAWVVEDDSLRWRWIALNRASLVIMAAYMVRAAGAQALVWLLITFALGCALLMLGQIIRVRRGWRLPVLLAGLAIWGVPGTPGFLARSVLVFPTGLSEAIPLFGIVVVAEMLLVAALWQLVFGASHLGENNQASEVRSATGRMPFHLLTSLELGLAMALLVVPLIVSGLAPHSLGRLIGMSESRAFPAVLWTVTHARRSVWIGLALSGVGGVILSLLRQRIFAQMRGWQSGIVALVSLEWLDRAVTGGLALVGAGLQYFARLGEGEGYLGWLLLAGLTLWLLLRG